MDSHELLTTRYLYDADLTPRIHEVLSYARSECPVAHSSGAGGFYWVTRYEDVKTVLTDDATFTSTKGKSLPVHQTVMMPPIDSDPPIHADFRRLLNKYFSKGGLTPFKDVIRETAAANIETWVDNGSCEFVSDFARPFVARVLARVILNIDDDDEILDAQRKVERFATENSPDAFMDLRNYVESFLDRRRNASDDSDDVISSLLNGSVEGRPLTQDELVGVIMILFIGGLDTTKGAISSVVHHLITEPDLEARLRDPDWIRRDLDEFLRFDSPVCGLARFVTRDTVLGGQALKENDAVLVHYGSANRDEEVFDNADELDFGRSKNPHVAFGLGVHRCLGSNLARMQIEVAIEELLGRVTRIRSQDPEVTVEFSPGLAYAPDSLPIVFDRA